MVNKLRMLHVRQNYDRGEFIRKLRTNPKLRKCWIEKANITPEQQIEYMKKHGNDYYVCIDNDDNMLGFVGVVDKDLRIATLPKYQGSGVGKFMMAFIIQHYEFKIKVRKRNVVGQRFFYDCGLPFDIVE
jgi:GNAT superfamily N-acetyltransferase